MVFWVRRFLGAVVLTAMVLSPTVGSGPVVAQSGDSSRYAAIVMDADSGEVLFERFADSRRYPASITKMMTLYLAFEALEAGRVRLDDMITVSAYAASRPPSKLGLSAGQTITLEDAMKAVAVRSCNDMAVAIAEHIAGSEAEFARRMTNKAHELGMSRTTFANANGLTDTRQTTTARDLTTLARAVRRDFPQYYRFLGIRYWNYNGREYRNTNGLLLTGDGYEGLKTGYTNASGYNLAAAASRDGRRIITIVLGGRSTQSRNAHVAELMNTGFELEQRRARGENLQIAQSFFESRGFGIGAPDTAVAYASATATPYSPIGGADLEDALEAEGGSDDTAIAYTALPLPPTPATQPPPPAVRAPPPPPIQAAALAAAPLNMTDSLNGGVQRPTAPPPEPAPAAPAAAAPPRATSRAPATPAVPAGRWSVQVGAFRAEADARRHLTDIGRRFRDQFRNADTDIQSASGWFRSRFTGFTEDRAHAACSAMQARNVDCMVIRP